MCVCVSTFYRLCRRYTLGSLCALVPLTGLRSCDVSRPRIALLHLEVKGGGGIMEGRGNDRSRESRKGLIESTTRERSGCFTSGSEEEGTPPSPPPRVLRCVSVRACVWPRASGPTHPSAPRRSDFASRGRTRGSERTNETVRQTSRVARRGVCVRRLASVERRPSTVAEEERGIASLRRKVLVRPRRVALTGRDSSDTP